MTREERAKLAFEITSSPEYFHYIRLHSQYFLEVCGLDADTYINEIGNKAYNGNSEIIEKYEPEDFDIFAINTRNEILDEAIRRNVDIRETIAYNEASEENKRNPKEYIEHYIK